MLEADRRGALSAVREIHFVQKEPDPLAPDGDTFFRIGAPPKPRVQPWEEYLGDVERAIREKSVRRKPSQRVTEVLYCVDVASTRTRGKIAIELYSRSLKKNGEWSDYKEYSANADHASSLPSAVDRDIIASMFGGVDYYSYYGYSTGTTRKILHHPLAMKLLPQMAAAAELRYRESGGSRFELVNWDDGDVVDPLVGNPSGRARSVGHHRIPASRRRAYGSERAALHAR